MFGGPCSVIVTGTGKHGKSCRRDAEASLPWKVRRLWYSIRRMDQIFGECKRLLLEDEPFVLATVVRTKGSTPQKPGAKLIVRRDGSTAGTLGGGCVEAEVWAKARVILEEKGQPQVCRFVLNEDLAAKDGLVCGGTMDILIDPIVDQPEFLSVVDEILEAIEGRGDRALATHVALEGREDVRSARMFLRSDGSVVGSLGGEALDALAIKSAMESMPTGGESWIETEEGSGVYVETYTNPATVVIVGGGHVGKAIYSVASFLDFRTIVVDDRERFANKERFPEAEVVVAESFDRGLRDLKLGPNHYVVVATRGHKLDDIALREAARSDAGYVGLLGSKRKAVLIFRDLIDQGIPEERVREIRAPIGLDLGGRQPADIAVSIMAEILAVKNDRSGGPLTMGEKLVDRFRRQATGK